MSHCHTVSYKLLQVSSSNIKGKPINISNRRGLRKGVPHGSVVVSFLFNTCIDDITYLVINSETWNCGDNIEIYICDVNRKTVLSKLETDTLLSTELLPEKIMKFNAA